MRLIVVALDGRVQWRKRKFQQDNVNGAMPSQSDAINELFAEHYKGASGPTLPVSRRIVVVLRARRIAGAVFVAVALL